MKERKPANPDVSLPRFSRSSEAFAVVVRRWHGDLYRFFRLLGAEGHEAEDHVQETFLRLFRGQRRYGVETLVGSPALVYRVARTVLLDGMRRLRRRPSCVSLSTLSEEPPADRQSAAGLPDLLDLREAVGGLPEKLRWVVILNIYQGLEYREVAKVLEIPLGTVKSRMHLALRALRERTYGRAPL